jgi:hypothetical protein
MPKTLKSRIARTAGWFGLLFLLLFAFRLLYGYFGASGYNDAGREPFCYVEI